MTPPQKYLKCASHLSDVGSNAASSFRCSGRWVVSSAGRASPLQGEGRGFDPLTTHQFRTVDLPRSTDVVSASHCTGGQQCGAVVQLVRIPACHAGGRGFESRPLRHFIPGWLAQLGEHRPYKARVGGSIPSPPTNSGLLTCPGQQTLSQPVTALEDSNAER